MTIFLNEEVVNTLRDRLEADLPAVITEINSSQTDPAYPMPAPAYVLDHIPLVSEMNAFPVVGISDGDIHFEDDVGWGATGLMDITVVAFVQSPNHQEMVWWLRRYGQALVRVMMDTRRINPAWSVVLKNVRPGPTLGRDENPRQWLSTTSVTITVKVEQDT